MSKTTSSSYCTTPSATQNCYECTANGSKKHAMAYSPDEAASNRLTKTLEVENRNFNSTRYDFDDKLAADGRTLLVITHDPEFILNSCQSVIRMEHGKVVEQYPLLGNEKQLVKAMVK